MKKLSFLVVHLMLSASICHSQHVKLGNQEWMVTNLDVNTFRNGDLIPEAKTKDEWNRAYWDKKPAWCYYNNDSINGKKYGRLYNWPAVIDPRGLAPQGWHIPHVSEWYELYNFLGGKKGGISRKLKSITGWKKERNGDNSVGLNALPAGMRLGVPLIKPNNGFAWQGSLSVWWGIEEPSCYNDRDACPGVRCFVLRSELRSDTEAVIEWTENRDGYSVRCIKD